MKKINKDQNILSDAEVDNIMHLLEAVYAATGDQRIFSVIDILMDETCNEIINNNALRPSKPTTG